jgi:hypothetical protein
MISTSPPAESELVTIDRLSMYIDPFVEIIALVMLHVVFFCTWVYPDSSSYSSSLPLVPDIRLSCTMKTHQYVLSFRFEMSSLR